MQDLANGTKDVRGAAFQIKSILPFLLLCLQFFRSLSLTLSLCSSYKFLCSFRFISHFHVYYCKRKFRRLTFFRLHFSFFFVLLFVFYSCTSTIMLLPLIYAQTFGGNPSVPPFLIPPTVPYST